MSIQEAFSSTAGIILFSALVFGAAAGVLSDRRKYFPARIATVFGWTCFGLSVACALCSVWIGVR